jgi:hypothetical protein
MINSLKIRGVLVLVCLLSFADGIAQNLSQHNWYFGNSVRGIRFSRSDNSASLLTNQATPFGTGGSSVGTDPTNANLLFYTDGARVFDVTHTQMPNGFGLNALTTANQPVAISQIPGVPSQYYIFTNTASFTTGGTISVTTVDMSASGNDVFPEPRIGNVTTKNVAIGLTGRSEGMITVPHANGTDFWLITHENGTDNYTVTLVGAAGSFTHTTQPNVTGFPSSVANFSYHEASGKIAVSPQSADDNVAILNFDNSTGALLLDQFILNSASSTTTAQSVYDTEWSNNGRFLYISRHGEAGIPADVLQYDLNNPGTSLTTVLSLLPNRSYGLQMAPDSSIYHLYQATAGGPFLVGRLANTDSIASRVVHTTDAFGGALNFAGTQFPSFSPRSNLNLTVSFVTDGTCSASPVTFYPLVTPAADSLVWDFGDGGGSNQWSPIYTYQSGGAFDVTVIAFLNGDTASATQTINLTQFDLQLTLVQDTTACECELPVNNGVPPCPNNTTDDFSVTVQTQGGSPTSFTWSNGDTGPTLTPDSAGYYYVVVTDATGCTAYAGVNIREYGATDQRANIWYFGQNAGIDFNNPPGVRAITGPINTQEGVSVISDRNGQVIFSTDGVHVYNRNDVEIPIPIPPGIGGEQGSTQSALIIPVPGDETLYYIFTTQEVHGSNTYELRYSLYDIKLNNGDGGLAEINQLLFARSTERITGNGNWLIAHEYGNNSFRAYPITGTGIGNPVISDIGSDHVVTDEYNGRGYMKLGTQLVVALPSFNVSNVLEFFDFDNTTGEITNLRSVNLNATAEQVYGIEFAGNKVFATLSGTPSFLREVYIDFEGNPVLIPPAGPSGPIPQQLGAIQLGPDGQIYVAVNNQPFLGTIQVNSDTLQLSNFTLNGFPLAGGTQSLLGLPNFIQSVGTGPMQASMAVAGVCLGDSTSFTGTGTDPIDEFEWSFGDGFGATTQDAMHLYAAAGAYVVTLRVTNRCGLDTLITQNITITAPPADPNFLPLGQQPVLCNGDLTLEAEPAPGTVGNLYLWSTGETTRTIAVSQQSRIDVTITNAQGCTSSGTIIVADNRPQVDLGPDQTLCQNSPVTPLDAQNPGTTYQWFLNEVSNGNTLQTQPVNTAAFGIFEYKVQVNDPITLCSIKDSVVFTINESPNFIATPTNTSGCGTNTGQIALTINSPATASFSYLVVGAASGTTLQGIDQPVGPVLPVFTGLAADTYIVQVSDQVSGCTTSTSVGISDNVISITSALARTPTCNPVLIDVQTTGIVDFTTSTYRIIDSGTGAQVGATTAFPAANFTTFAVPVPGNYTIQVNAQGCIATQNISIVSDPQTVVSFLPNLCNGQITAQPAGAVSYDWSTSQAGSINGATNAPTVTLNQGTWNLTVIVNDGVLCPGTGNVTVTVEPPLVANFTQSDACEDIVTLSATPTGPYTYRWYDNGVLLVGGSSIIIGTSENGATYGVEVVSTLTGCVSSRFSQQVFVAGDLQLTMTTTTPCEGSNFTLTGTSNIVGTNFQWGVNGNDIAGATLPTLVRNTGGLYRLTGSLPGCTEVIRELVILFPLTAGSLPARALICPDIANPNPDTRQVLLDAGPNFVSYNWLQGGVPIGVTTQTHTATEEGIFGVELVNSYGCPSTDQTDVIEECNPRIVAPTAFRPGSTVTANSTFYVFTYFISNEDFQIFLYNRWGELVYQSNGLGAEGDKSKEWNGGYNNNTGQLLPAGTYSYVVKYKSSYRPEDGIQEKRGGVVLLR